MWLGICLGRALDASQEIIDTGKDLFTLVSREREKKMTTQLNDKDQYLLDLVEGYTGDANITNWTDHKLLTPLGEHWELVRQSEVEEMLDDGKWKDHYPKMSRDEVRALIPQDALDAIGRLESHIRAKGTTLALNEVATSLTE